MEESNNQPPPLPSKPSMKIIKISKSEIYDNDEEKKGERKGSFTTSDEHLIPPPLPSKEKRRSMGINDEHFPLPKENISSTATENNQPPPLPNKEKRPSVGIEKNEPPSLPPKKMAEKKPPKIPKKPSSKQFLIKSKKIEEKSFTDEQLKQFIAIESNINELIKNKMENMKSKQEKNTMKVNNNDLLDTCSNLKNALQNEKTNKKESFQILKKIEKGRKLEIKKWFKKSEMTVVNETDLLKWGRKTF